MITAIAPTTPPIMGADARGAWVGGDAVVAGRVVKVSMAGEVMVCNNTIIACNNTY